MCVGTGGLGSPLALYLAAAGVGKLGLVEFDAVDYTNLQRQVIHGTSDVGRLKLESAIEKLTGDQSHSWKSSASKRYLRARTRSTFSRLRHDCRWHR